jgi:hypothetical protein
VDSQKQKALLDEITAKVEGVELEKTEDLSDEKLEGSRKQNKTGKHSCSDVKTIFIFV